MPTWLLPESIADILPAEARKIENLRRQLLDLYRCHGYELVQPPLLEYLDALLTGTGRDLNLRTFKLVDQLSGRTLGVRADITPQVARIDAHLLNRTGVTRLCYTGSVLHTRPAGVFATREPLQIGAELYGHAGIEADLEILDLMLNSLQRAGIQHIRLEISHVGLVRAILLTDSAAQDQQADILSFLQGKDIPALQSLQGVAPATKQALLILAQSVGNLRDAAAPTIWQTTQQQLLNCGLPQAACQQIASAWQSLDALAHAPLLAQHPECSLGLDLGDVRGFDYHSGLTFTAYCAGLPNAVARGGRYDDVGQVFGRARPATGFSLELRELAGLLPAAAPVRAIRAPWLQDVKLLQTIAQLRAQGEIVVQCLPSEVPPEQQEFVFDRVLVKIDSSDGSIWQIQPLTLA